MKEPLIKGGCGHSDAEIEFSSMVCAVVLGFGAVCFIILLAVSVTQLF